jgi:hypothetical protein
MSEPKLVTGEGALGRWAALGDVYPAASHQRCWVLAHVRQIGVNVLEARWTTVDPKVKNHFVVEVWDIQALKSCVQLLRNIEGVVDSCRVTPSG